MAHVGTVPVGLHICAFCSIEVAQCALVNHGLDVAYTPNRDRLDESTTSGLVQTVPCLARRPARISRTTFAVGFPTRLDGRTVHRGAQRQRNANNGREIHIVVKNDLEMKKKCHLDG